MPGPFINTLPVRVRRREGVLAAVSAMRGQLAELLGHEHAPLALAQQASGVAGTRRCSRRLFNYRHNTGASRARAGDGMEGPVFFTGAHQLSRSSVVVDDDGDGIGLVVDAVAPVDPPSGCRVGRDGGGEPGSALEGALEGGADLPLSAVEVLDAAERRRVLVGVE